jgi:hypothetical protein
MGKWIDFMLLLMRFMFRGGSYIRKGYGFGKRRRREMKSVFMISCIHFH